MEGRGSGKWRGKWCEKLFEIYINGGERIVVATVHREKELVSGYVRGPWGKDGILFFLKTFCSLPVHTMASDVGAIKEEGTSDASADERGPRAPAGGQRGAGPKDQEGRGPNEVGTRVQGGSPHEEGCRLYPVEEFMQTFVRQEAEMWQKGGLFSIAGEHLGLSPYCSTVALFWWWWWGHRVGAYWCAPLDST